MEIFEDDIQLILEHVDGVTRDDIITALAVYGNIEAAILSLLA